MTHLIRIATRIARSALALAVVVALSLSPLMPVAAPGGAALAPSGQHHAHSAYHGANVHHAAADHECCAPESGPQDCLAFCLQACATSLFAPAETHGRLQAAGAWDLPPALLRLGAGPETETPPPKALT